jgi:uncharacterized membrane protein
LTDIKTDPQQVPPGWDYSPSTWPERLPILGAALLGFLIAGYMALFQFGIIDTVFEPFFGDGSRIVLTSPLSTLLVIPDAALGAMVYLLDIVLGSIGGAARWRTMPWTVITFGIAVGPLGAVSIILVVLQPLLYDAFCTLCLVTAAISVLMIGPVMDEVLATLQHMNRECSRGRSLWRVFWGLED